MYIPSLNISSFSSSLIANAGSTLVDVAGEIFRKTMELENLIPATIVIVGSVIFLYREKQNRNIIQTHLRTIERQKEFIQGHLGTNERLQGIIKKLEGVVEKQEGIIEEQGKSNQDHKRIIDVLQSNQKLIQDQQETFLTLTKVVQKQEDAIRGLKETSSQKNGLLQRQDERIQRQDEEIQRLQAIILEQRNENPEMG